MKVRAVLTGALRKLGVVGGVGRRTPTDQEYADCLPILLSMYRALISAGTFGRLRDVIPRGDYVAGENQRIYRRYNEAQEILLPDMVSDCGSLGYVGCNDVEQSWSPPNTDYGRKRYGYHNNSNRRTIRDNSIVTIVDEFSHDILEAMYDGQRKAWFILSDLDTGEEWDESNSWSTDRLNQALDLEAPLSHRNYNGLVSLVATMLADDFGAEVSGTIMQQANQFRSGLTTNYSTYKRDDDEWLTSI